MEFKKIYNNPYLLIKFFQILFVAIWLRTGLFEVVERGADLFVTRNRDSQSLIENRIQTEDFAVRREDFLKNSPAARGWELGQLLRSPWSCELSFIPHAWNQAIDLSRDLVMRRIFPD